MFDQEIVIPGLGVITAQAESKFRASRWAGSVQRPFRTWATSLSPALLADFGRRVAANEASPEAWSEGLAQEIHPRTPIDRGHPHV